MYSRKDTLPKTTVDENSVRGNQLTISTLDSPAAHKLSWQHYKDGVRAKQAARAAAEVAVDSVESQNVPHDAKNRRGARKNYSGQCDSGSDDSDHEFDHEAPEPEGRHWASGSRGRDPDQFDDDADHQPDGDEADYQPDSDEAEDQPTGNEPHADPHSQNDQPDSEGDDERNDESNDKVETRNDDVGLQDMPIIDYEITNGALLKTAKKEAERARDEYHAKIRDIARAQNKTVSTVLQAIGELPVALRSNNSWNAHQVEYRHQHPKPHDMTSEAYLKACRNAYEARFEHLPKEERSDPAARAMAVAGLMKWYREMHADVVQNDKGKGRGAVMLKKIAKSFIDQSRAAYNHYDVDIWGWVLDRYSDQAQFWGCSPAYDMVVDKYGDRVLQQELFNWKARIQTMVMEQREKENDIQQEGVAIHINFTQHKKEKARDAMRRQLARLLLNLIYLVLLERGEEMETIDTLFKKGFPWKEDTGSVSQTDALGDMHRQLKAIYKGEELDEESDDNNDNEQEKPGPVTNESWTEGTLRSAASMNGLIEFGRGNGAGRSEGGGHRRMRRWHLSGESQRFSRSDPCLGQSQQAQGLENPQAEGRYHSRRRHRRAECQTPPIAQTAAVLLVPTPFLVTTLLLVPRPFSVPRAFRDAAPHAQRRASLAHHAAPFPVRRIHCVYVNGDRISDLFLIPKFDILMEGEIPPPVYGDVWFYSPGPQVWKELPSHLVRSLDAKQIPTLECLRMNVGLF
ncbi:hypothetical protein MSAN_02078400 [Mycena sanguinolenta]|uniref:Uncharacterized protein n=1 Tax=Mycena sanguinolenta TaxID=230812 RepID=A0A8H6XHV4_9AGAR|nr:hypothetical protein MSAN_02078400 [Mycena sanguinolenta]